MLRRAAIAAGCPPGSLTARHVAALDALVTALARAALGGPARGESGPCAGMASCLAVTAGRTAADGQADGTDEAEGAGGRD